MIEVLIKLSKMLNYLNTKQLIHLEWIFLLIEKSRDKTGQTLIIPTGISLSIPENFEIQIRPRSGLAAKSNITVLNTPGTIDADYRGEIKVILINLGNKTFTIEKGARIAQMVLCPIIKMNLKDVENLDDTSRGSGGFGSTGIK